MSKNIPEVTAGNTITLSCMFKNPDGVISNPDIVKIRFYNYKYDLLDEFILGESNRRLSGEYYFYYTTPNESKNFCYEWYSEYAGKPILTRDLFKTIKIKR